MAYHDPRAEADRASLVLSLRSLARHEHDDLSIADDAAARHLLRVRHPPAGTALRTGASAMSDTPIRRAPTDGHRVYEWREAQRVRVRCPKCDGEGWIYCPPIGHELRKQRKEAGITMRALAKQLGISPTYLSDLENDRRGWNGRLVNRYQHAIGTKPR